MTTEKWINTLVWLADKYKSDNSTDENSWKYAAERCASAVLDKNPNLLI